MILAAVGGGALGNFIRARGQNQNERDSLLNQEQAKFRESIWNELTAQRDLVNGYRAELQKSFAEVSRLHDELTATQTELRATKAELDTARQDQNDMADTLNRTTNQMQVVMLERDHLRNVASELKVTLAEHQQTGEQLKHTVAEHEAGAAVRVKQIAELQAQVAALQCDLARVTQRSPEARTRATDEETS